MAEMKLTVSEIKELMDKMAANCLTEVSVKVEGFELSLKAEQTQVVYEAAVPGTPMPAAALAPTAACPCEEASGQVVKSPLDWDSLRQFRSGQSGRLPQLATAVHKGDTLFHVESMKL